MPRDGAGNYSLPVGYFVNIGDDILPSQHNPPLEDLAQGVSGSLARSGAGGMTGNLNLGGNSISNADTVTADTVNAGALAGDAIMDAGDLREATSGKLVTTDAIWNDAESVDLGNLTGTVAVDFSTFLGLAHGVATGNVTLGAISNAKPGQTVVFDIAQDGTGGWTIAYNSTYWLAPGGEIEWDTTASARNILIATILRDDKAILVSATAAGGAE